MKQAVTKALIAAALVMLIAMPFMSKAQNTQYYPPRTLVLTNNTPEELAYCYAYQDMTSSVWTSVGWSKIMAYSSSTITIGIASMPTFFVHAQNAKGNIWGGDNYFCANTDAFNIPYADQPACGSKIRFRAILSNNSGETDYTFSH